MKPDGGHFGEGFLTTGFGVALTVVLALGFGEGLVVDAKTVLVDAIIAPATINESTRPLIRDSI